MRRVAFALILGVAALTAEQLMAQSLAQKPSFEVASNFQLVGEPGWISTERFDIEARGDTGAVANARDEAMRQMLRSLLEERFQLKVHREIREQPVFILSVARDGAKLKPTIEGRPSPGGLGLGSTQNNATFAGVEMTGSGITMDRLVNMLAPSAGRPVIDKTNLTGMYDFT